MNISERDRLMSWYHENHRVMPWRRDREPYRILVSEFMLQQTTVSAVIPLYERWMSIFPTVEALAKAEVEEVMQAWSGLGYYQRARRLHQTARALASRGTYPSTLSGWLELPGLGPYTAAAVTSIAYGLPYLALDTNALRVLLRYYGSLEPVEKRSTHRALREDLEPLLQDVDAGIFNQAVMELGATHCSPREPRCLVCPLQKGCRARLMGNAEEIPRRKAKKPVRRTPVASYLPVDQHGRILLLRGTPLGLLQDLYQPPLDAFEENREDWAGSDFILSLRERQNSLGLAASASLGYSISGRRLEIEVYSFPWDDISAKALEPVTHLAGLASVWVSPDSAESGGAVSSLTRKIISAWTGSRSALQPKGGRSAQCEL